MERTITVKGTGRISKAPDQIAVSLEMERRDRAYDQVVALANMAVAQLTAAIRDAGMDEKQLRTQSYQIDTVYDSIQNGQGSYRRVFGGYRCRIRMAVRFPLDMRVLGRVLQGISACGASPEIGIRFGLADEDAAKDELLADAARDARKKAELLAAAAEVRLGALLSIQYAWSELRFEADTEFLCDAVAKPCAAPDIDLAPEDVERSDTAVFVWAIE